MTETAPPAVTVVIVDWNEPEVTLEAVASVLAQQGVTCEVVVVDNGSERTAAGHPAAAHAGVRIVRLPTNRGFAGGANAGIAAARGAAIVLLNNDARLAPGALAALVAPLAEPGVGAATALILLDGTEPPLVNSTGGEVTRSGNGRDRDWRTPLAELTRPAGAAPAFSGGAAALSRAALADVAVPMIPGAFDERLFMYYEDTELSWRLRRRGWEIRYVPGAVVHHRHAHSSGAGSPFFLRLNERNRLRFTLVHATPGIAARALARTLAGATTRLLRGDAAGAARRLGAAAHALTHLPSLLSTRRAIARTATVPLRELWSGAPTDAPTTTPSGS
jgi:GT2 family glycosyltransferase